MAKLTVIGATTQDEYRNTILKNAALARRFNEVKVNAPSAQDSFNILMGIRDLYEKHHNVILPDNVLKAAVDFSIQYIPQRSLPDKAIDLIDMTAAHLAAQHPATDVKSLEKEIARTSGKLNNKGFLAKAPEDVVKKEQDKLAEFEEKMKSLNERLAFLENL